MERSAPEISTKAQFESDSLLDLSYIEPVDVSAGEDFVLDLDVEEAQNGSASAAVSYQLPAERAAFVEPEISPAAASEMGSHYTYAPEQAAMDVSSVETHAVVAEPYTAEPASTIEAAEVVPTGVSPQHVSDVQSAAEVTSAGQLSPEMIDAIARRAVEMMSDKVVREIAWEVVPDLAELLIKRQLEEKESQPK